MKNIIKVIIFIAIIILVISGCSNNITPDTETEQTSVEKQTDNTTTESILRKDNQQEEDDYYKFGNNIDNKLQEEQQPRSNKQIYYSPFSGRAINKPLLRKAVMISVENSPAARPQAGLAEAPLVYEFLVEGGITRFLALYWDQIPDKIGPIRSLRPYLIEIASNYNPLLLHAGASPDGFAMLSQIDINNLDQIYNGKYYWRSSNSKAPHNLYTGNFKIEDYLNNLTGQEYQSRFSYESVSIIQDNDTRAEEIFINYWGNYRVLYKFDSRKNLYKRYLNDFTDPHLVESGEQITVNNIIVQYADTEVKDKAGRLDIELLGSGKALLFRNGIVINGSWKREQKSWTNFYDNNGNKINLNPGKTWIQVVPVSAKVKYQESDNNEKRN